MKHLIIAVFALAMASCTSRVDKEIKIINNKLDANYTKLEQLVIAEEYEKAERLVLENRELKDKRNLLYRVY